VTLLNNNDPKVNKAVCENACRLRRCVQRYYTTTATRSGAGKVGTYMPIVLQGGSVRNVESTSRVKVSLGIGP
jgi:hypothetical protein